jgi:hypothetical protein
VEAEEAVLLLTALELVAERVDERGIGEGDPERDDREDGRRRTERTDAGDQEHGEAGDDPEEAPTGHR